MSNTDSLVFVVTTLVLVLTMISHNVEATRGCGYNSKSDCKHSCNLFVYSCEEDEQFSSRYCCRSLFLRPSCMTKHECRKSCGSKRCEYDNKAVDGWRCYKCVYTLAEAAIAGVVLGIIALIIIVIVMCCYFCAFCPWYTHRHGVVVAPPVYIEPMPMPPPPPPPPVVAFGVPMYA